MAELTGILEALLVVVFVVVDVVVFVCVFSSLVESAIADFDNTTTVISNNNKAKFVSINFILNPQ